MKAKINTFIYLEYILKKKIESHHFNNYFIFNSGYNNNVVISLYSNNKLLLDIEYKI